MLKARDANSTKIVSRTDQPSATPVERTLCRGFVVHRGLREDHPDFFRIGSRLVIVASIPLAIGISGDVAVVFFKTTDDAIVALSAGAIALLVLLGFWLVYPLWQRVRYPA